MNVSSWANLGSSLVTLISAHWDHKSDRRNVSLSLVGMGWGHIPPISAPRPEIPFLTALKLENYHWHFDWHNYEALAPE